MNDFKKTLKIRNACMIVTALIIAVIYFVLLIIKDRSEISTDAIHFQTGIFMVLEIILLGSTLRNVFTMKSHEKLQTLYIKENDERNAMIKQKTGSMLLPINAAGFGIAANMAIYYSQTVFFTLVGAIGFMALVKIILRLYYGRKY